MDASTRSRDRRNVVLTGFMATGKTTVGRLLAERLGYDFVDTDHVIEAEHGPIPTIFERHGEEHFRRLERDVAADLAGRTGLVIGTGGRLLLDEANAERLGSTGHVFCLRASVDTIVRRLAAGGTSERPLLAGHDVRARIETLLAERGAAYARFEQVDTDDRQPAAIVDELLLRFGDRD